MSLPLFLRLKGHSTKRRGLSLLNVFGLAIGLSVFVFIAQYARYEWSYDQFHEDAERMYRVTYARERPGQEPYVSAASFPALAPAIGREFEEVEATCRVVPVWGLKGLIVWGDRSVESEFINYADPNVFEFFSFEVLRGNPASALDNQHTLAISNSKAKALFGQEDPIGQRVEMQTRDGRYFFEVTAVFDDSKPTHMKTDVFLSWTSLYAIPNVDKATIEDNWRWQQYPAYVKLMPGITPEQLVDKFPSLVIKYLPEHPARDQISFGLQPLTSIHLHSHLYREMEQNGDAQVVNTLVIIGILVLVIAWINYVNLYTAQVGDYLKAVGIRKTLGASWRNLFIRFLKESAAYSLIAVLLSALLLFVLKPVIIQQVGLNMPNDALLTVGDVFLLAGLWLLTTLVCGIYPATLLAGINPLKALAQQDDRLGSGRLRKALVIFQFAASALLVGSTLVIQQQLQYMTALDMGINKEDVLVIDTYLYDLGEPEHQRKMELLKNELLGQPGVSGAGYVSEVVGDGAAFTTSSSVLGQNTAERGWKIVDLQMVSDEYLPLLETKLLAGRHFQYELDTQNLIINRQAMALYGFGQPEEALNQRIVFPGPGDTLRIIGVIEDFMQQSAKEGFHPGVFRNNAWELSKVVVKVDERYRSQLIDFARESHARLFPKSPFNFKMVDDILAENNQTENDFASLLNLFSGLSILIALMGILALSYFVASKRQKEVCVRKVLGSGNRAVIVLVFKDFARLVLLGNVVAIPLMYYASEQWLNQFAQRIDFAWWIPALAGLLSLLLAFLFSYVNLVKLARTNPAQVLRS